MGVNTSDSDFSTVEKAGGVKTVSLSKAQMPRHGHNSSEPVGTYDSSIYQNTSGTNIKVVYAEIAYSTREVNEYRSGFGSGYFTNKSVSAEYGVPPEGEGAAHNNLQPYITCYMWKRTA